MIIDIFAIGLKMVILVCVAVIGAAVCSVCVAYGLSRRGFSISS